MNPKYDPRHGTRDSTGKEKRLAWRAFEELQRNYLSVTLVPAPQQNFDGHMIRAVENKNPKWYSNFVEGYDYQVKRWRVLRALRRVFKKGLVRRNGYELKLLKHIQEWKGREDEQTDGVPNGWDAVFEGTGPRPQVGKKNGEIQHPCDRRR